ncbi:MAG: DUF2142 domain-containing protein, partial [Chloroflexi bacterium]|nr:DUF2142 domain-containing protein [Chloroflexota bacterium]
MRERKAILTIIALFVVLSFSASVINPLHEATDELRHYRFVQHIVQLKALPVQGALPCRAQGHHPPLYYTVAAAASFWVDTGRDICTGPPENPFWNYRQWEVSEDNKNLYLHGPEEAFPWSGEALAAHIARGVNVLIGAITVYLTWLLGCAIWPNRPMLALGGTAFIAFNPMFVYMAGAINNDVIAAMSGTAVTLACVRLVQDEQGLSRRWGVILGLLFGIALLSKFNLIAIGGTVAVAATWVAWQRKQWRLWVEVAVIAGVVTLLVAGWWFVRNQMLYGEPTGVQRLTELWGKRDPSESWGIAVYELTPTWTSLWGRFGYGQIPIPELIYNGLRWIVGAGMIGLLVPIVLRRAGEVRLVGIPLLLLLLNIGLFFVVVFYYLLISPAGAMGRFFFPALSSLSLLSFYGLSRWVSVFARDDDGVRLQSLMGALAAGVVGLMVVITAVALWGYLASAYARPATFAVDTAVPNPTNAQFDTLVNLRGYEVAETAVQAGTPLDIDLYWEVTAQPPGNYLLFVHLIDNETGEMIVQRDTHPGLGNAPSQYWQQGDRFVESVRLWLPEGAYTPSTAALSIGLYVPGAYRLGIIGADGSRLGDAFELSQIQVEPWAASGHEQQYPNPLDQNFEGKLRLIGYEYSQRIGTSDNQIDVTLYWEALGSERDDYLVQLRLIDADGVVRAVLTEPPNGAEPDASQWLEGQIVVDTHQLPIAANNL